eukprot:203457_1
MYMLYNVEVVHSYERATMEAQEMTRLVSKCASHNEYEHLVFGYINQHFNTIVPLDIMYLIFIYYYHKYQFITDSRNSLILRFINDRMVTKRVSSGWNTCIYGEPITNTQCDTCRVQITWLKCSSQLSNFFMGFYNGNQSNDELDWKNHLGEYGNERNSVGIYVGKGRHHFILYDKNNRHETLWDHRELPAFDEGDTFSLLFDFIHSVVTIYHNDKKAGLLPLEDDQTSVIPAFSLSSADDLLRVLLF